VSVASASAQVCAGVDGCVSTLTAHGAPVDSWVENVALPLPITSISAPPFSGNARVSFARRPVVVTPAV
jgi:hypothetical protein